MRTQQTLNDQAAAHLTHLATRFLQLAATWSAKERLRSWYATAHAAAAAQDAWVATV